MHLIVLLRLNFFTGAEFALLGAADEAQHTGDGAAQPSGAPMRFSRSFRNWKCRRRCPVFVCLVCLACSLAQADEQQTFWDPAREVASALEVLRVRSTHAAWLAWWRHLEGDRLLAMARGEQAVDASLLWKSCQRLEHPTARGEPEFYGLYEALLDWRVELELPRVQSLPESIRLAAAQDSLPGSRELGPMIAATRLAAERTSLSLRGPHAAAWRSYLMLPVLSTLPETPAADTLANLKEAYRRTVAGHAGLDQRGVVALRSALGRLVSALESTADAVSSSQRRERMLDLAAALEVLDRGPDPAAERTVSSAVGWLEQSAERRPFAYAVRRRYTWPNVSIDVSADFVRKHSVVPFERTEPVHERIQDISIHGDRTARGKIWLELVPHPAKLSFDLLLQGDFVAHTVGRAQRAQVFSDTTGEFSGRKRVNFDGNAFVTSSVAAIVRQSSHVRCISVDVIRLFRRFALRRAWAETSARRGTIEAISRERNEAKVREAFDRQTDAALERVRQGYVERVWSPLQRYGELPRLARIATTAEGVKYRALVTDEQAVGAFAAPPVAAGSNMLTVHLHESAIAHLARELPQFAVLASFVRDAGKYANTWTVASQVSPLLDAGSEHQLAVAVGESTLQVKFQLPDQRGHNLRATATYDLRKVGAGHGGVALEPIEVTLDGEPKPLLVAFIRSQIPQLRRTLAQSSSAAHPIWWGRGNIALNGAASEGGWLTLSWREAPRAGTDN
jgi:hypothetical protein